MTRQIIALLALLLLGLSACDSNGPSSRISNLTSTELGAVVRAFRVAWQTPPLSAKAVTIQAAASTMTGKPLPLPTVTANGQVSFGGHPEIVVQYDAAHDDLRLTNSDLASQRYPGPDVGLAAAQAEALSYVKDLAAQGVIDERHYDLTSPKIGYTRAGYGSKTSGQAAEWIKEYRFIFLRNINGVPFANAGLTVGIHRSGERSSIRYGGGQVFSTWDGQTEKPSVDGWESTRQVLTSDIQSRFSSELPGPKTVLWQRLMYIIPNATTSAVIEPVYAFAYAAHHFTPNGSQITGRLHVRGYSVTLPSAVAQSFDYEGGLVPGDAKK